MKIYKQQEIFDCGICVTQSLINFFYKKEISREELISNANVSQDGMSILDLEKINQKYGILLDSYELSFEEFIEYKTKDYFILLLDLQSGNHYVIAKKVHDGIVMFDSVAGKKKLSYAQLKPYYANIFIEIKKQTTSLKLINQQLEQKIQIDWVAFSKIFIINIIVLSLTVISGYFIKTIFDSVIASNEISNLGIIIFIAVFGYLTNNFGNFLIEILEANQLQKYYKQLSHELLNRLAHKNNNFFHKISQHQFVMLNYHVEIISKYYSRYFHSFFVNLLNVIVLFIFVLILDWRIISIILTSVVVQMGYTFFAYKFNKKQYPKIKFLIDQSKENYFNLKKFMQDEINNKKLILLLQKIQNNAAHQAAFNYKWSLYNGYFDKVNNFFTSLINLMLYSLGAYLLIRSEIKFSNLIMATTFYGYINNSFAKLVDFYFYTVDFNFSQKIYLNFLSVANNNNQGLAWENIKEIKLENIAFFNDDKKVFKNLNLKIKNNTFIQGPSGSGKSTLYKLICRTLIPSQGLIKFNNINTDFFNMNEFNVNVIYQKNISYIPDYSWKKILRNLNQKEKDTIIAVAELMNLELKDNLKIQQLSSGQAQFLNLLLLLEYHNKLIILDEATSHIDKQIKNILYQTIIAKIGENNFLICTEHDLDIADFFRETIILKEHQYAKY